MKTIVCLSFLLLCVFTFNLDSPRANLKELVENFKSSKSKAGFYKDIKNVYYLYGSIHFLEINKSETKTLKVCEELESKKLIKTYDSISDLYYFYKLVNLAECKIPLENNTVALITENLKLDDLESLHKAAAFGFLYNQLSDTQINNICEKIGDFIDATGAGKNGKKQDGSYDQTATVLEIANYCYENVKKSFNMEKLNEPFKKAIKGILLNSQVLNKNSRAIFDSKCPLAATAAILYNVKRLLKYLPSTEFSDAIPEFLSFIKDSYSSVTCTRGKFQVYRVFWLFSNFPLLTLDSKPILSSEKKKSSLNAKVHNIYGENLDGFELKAALELNGKQLLEKFSFTKKNNDKNFNAVAEIDTVGITEFRHYDISVSVSANNESYKILDVVSISTKVSVSKLKYDVLQSKNTPVTFTYEVDSNKKNKNLVEANQNSLIHIQFQLKFEDSKKVVPIKQIAVRLNHPKYKTTTNLVNAVLDVTTHIYKAVIDIGDPDHIHAFNGIYSCDLIVSDELLSDPIKWNFADFNITFQKANAKTPLTDIDYVPLNLITHYFPSDRKSPPSIIIFTFVVAISLCLIIFFGILSVINVNCSQFPSDLRGAFFSVLFVGVLLGYFALLILFWVQINLIETLTILTAVFIPTILIGNEALSSLKLKEVESIDDEKKKFE